MGLMIAWPLGTAANRFGQLPDEKFSRETGPVTNDPQVLSMALKSYNRKRTLKGFFVGAIALAAFVVPWIIGMPPTIIAICILGGVLFKSFWEMERRLKTMQLRLAMIYDKLDASKHNEHLMGELTDY
jgi:hypothetical protein